MAKKEEEINKEWEDYANTHLKGKTVELARYMTKEEADNMGWYHRPVVLQFTDGTVLYPSSDDEGNNAGALFGQTKTEELTFPVL